MRFIYILVVFALISKQPSDKIIAQGGNVVAGNLILSGKSITKLDTVPVFSGALSTSISSTKAIVQFVDTTINDSSKVWRTLMLGMGQVNSDWNSSSGVSQILNKTT